MRRTHHYTRGFNPAIVGMASKAPLYRQAATPLTTMTDARTCNAAWAPEIKLRTTDGSRVCEVVGDIEPACPWCPWANRIHTVPDVRVSSLKDQASSTPGLRRRRQVPCFHPYMGFWDDDDEDAAITLQWTT